MASSILCNSEKAYSWSLSASQPFPRSPRWVIDLIALPGTFYSLLSPWPADREAGSQNTFSQSCSEYSLCQKGKGLPHTCFWDHIPATASRATLRTGKKQMKGRSLLPPWHLATRHVHSPTSHTASKPRQDIYRLCLAWPVLRPWRKSRWKQGKKKGQNRSEEMGEDACGWLLQTAWGDR
jgi:hypothetical protein